MRRRFTTGFLLLASVLWLLVSTGCTAASTTSEPATVPAQTEETAAQNTSSQIYLYGESHSNEMQLKKSWKFGRATMPQECGICLWKWLLTRPSI